MQEDLTFKAGELLVITYGDYSDKEWHGPLRVIKTFTQSAVGKAYVEATPRRKLGNWVEPTPTDDFVPWLVKEGYVEAIDDCREWDIGSYNGFEL